MKTRLSTLSDFSGCSNKVTDRSNLRKRRFMLAHSLQEPSGWGREGKQEFLRQLIT